MNNYVKGRYYEYKVKEILERNGYIVFRSAGSHGFFDLIALHPITKTILFIQVKKDFKKDENIKRAIKILKDFGNFAKVYFQVWYKGLRNFKVKNLFEL